MDTDWKEKVIVAAIDFGTACTGCAISYKADYLKKKENMITPYWHSGGSLSNTKTPTVLLLHKDLSFKSFGFVAEEDFADIATDPDSNIADWHYFRYFKMKLYDENKDSKIRLQSTVTDQMGREINAMHVFSTSIKYLKYKIMETIGDTFLIRNESDVYFILTCPAIWSDKAKRFMRLAAEKAGIANDHLRIGLEPECAAIFLHNVTMPDLSAFGNETFDMKEGDAYMIVDMGSNQL
ncbi:heat shock 70 kDa protein 12A-like [Dreissena polymorpha]|uniref:heat shock 70 kDa protein 12A-like n=1 Tax=Dreissena polymorpha TaxID=45954 RepID=UPI0022642BC2|nr:heat shock 70 kDa protein 12A-like [Dreissena polymorpha]